MWTLIDDFRTLDWIKIYAYPDIILQQTQELLQNPV